MPVILKLTFPAGRYHATPWGRHVNEGVAEWPPSPWRLLRALIATWKRTCADVDEQSIRNILEPLLSAPKFLLPLASVAHTRHYMPVNRGSGTGRTLVFDTFVSLSRCQSLYIGWEAATLGSNEEAILSRLVANLGSLGRAESWVEAELWHGTKPAWNCDPVVISGVEPVPVFCADPVTALGSEHYPVLDAKKLKRGQLPLGDHLFDCPPWHLCLDTETIHSKKWSQVPGSLWVSYGRRSDAFTGEPRRKANPMTSRPTLTVARFALDGAVLPRVTETVAVADKFRTALMGRFATIVRRRLGLPREATWRTHPELRSRTFSGRDGGGKIEGSHGHAYFLPTDEDDDGRIDHLTVVASGGFQPDETAALDSLRQVSIAEVDIRLQLVGLGAPGDFRSRLFGPSKVWVSATPFVVTRHVKARGQKKDAAECRGIDGRPAFARLVLGEELRRWLGRRGAEESAPEVSPLARDRSGRQPGVLEFRRARPGKPGDDGFRRAAGEFTLTFHEPMTGPICLGHSSHFGLGLFLPPTLPSPP